MKSQLPKLQATSWEPLNRCARAIAKLHSRNGRDAALRRPVDAARRPYRELEMTSGNQDLVAAAFHSTFEFRYSFGIGHSDFVISHRSHALARARAFVQPAQSCFRVAGFMAGSHPPSTRPFRAIPLFPFPQPTPPPPRNAGPRAPPVPNTRGPGGSPEE